MPKVNERRSAFMRGLWIPVLVTELVVLAAASASPQDTPEAVLLWERELSGKVINLDVSSDGQCVAVTTTTGIALLRTNGQLLWERPFLNQWMAASINTARQRPLAVAPRCRWVAVAGASNYRYVWLFGPRGQARAHIATPGTPEALAITHHGDILGIGTAAGHLLLANSNGVVQRDVTLADRSNIFDRLRFSPDDALLLTTVAGGTAALFTKGGETIWSRQLMYWMTTEVSDDWERFLIVGLPGHGVMIGWVEIVARDGRTLWKRYVLNPIARMSADGRRFVVSSSDPQSEEEKESANLLPQTVLNRDGQVVSTPGGGAERMVDSQDAGRCRSFPAERTLVCRDRDGRALWRLSEFPGYDRPWGYTPDLRLLLISPKGRWPVLAEERLLRAYRPPTTEEAAAAAKLPPPDPARLPPEKLRP
jgi:hypothetical protein